MNSDVLLVRSTVEENEGVGRISFDVSKNTYGVTDMGKKPFVVLMAEDDEHDIIATRRAWEKNNIANPLYVVNDGEECLDYLYRRGKYAKKGAAPRPGIVLLDINMPKIDGLTVLKKIRKDNALRCLPVIILTTSKADEDRLRSYDLGVNAYVVKPVGMENFSVAVKTINLFWELVELPNHDCGDSYGPLIDTGVAA